MFPICAEMSKTVRNELGTETVWIPVVIIEFGQVGKDGDTWPVAIVRVTETSEFSHVELQNLRGLRIKCAD